MNISPTRPDDTTGRVRWSDLRVEVGVLTSTGRHIDASAKMWVPGLGPFTIRGLRLHRHEADGGWSLMMPGRTLDMGWTNLIDVPRAVRQVLTDAIIEAGVERGLIGREVAAASDLERP